MKPRISMVTLGVTNLARSIEFYEQGLGFPRMDSPPEVAFFTLNGTWLGIYGRDSLVKDIGIAPIEPAHGAFSLAHNVESEEEVDKLMDEAKLAGATVLREPYQMEWGGYCGFFSDPDGHVWEIAHNPHFWVGPK